MPDSNSTTPSQQTPADIAREVFRRLAIRRIAPTPEAYREIYEEIAGVRTLTPSETALNDFIGALADTPAEVTRLSKRMQEAVNEKDWSAVGRHLRQLAEKHLHPKEAPASKEETSPSPVIEIAEPVPTPTVSIPLVDEATPAPSRLVSIPLIDEPPITAMPGAVALRNEDVDEDSPEPPAESDPMPLRDSPLVDASMTRLLREMMVRTLRFVVTPLLGDTSTLAKESDELANAIHLARNRTALSSLAPRFKEFCFKAEMKSGDLAEERELLLRLFRLLIENIGELVEDDSWLSGQIANVQDILSGPIQYASLMDATRSLKEVIYKQSMLKHSLSEAKTRTKDLIMVTIDQLGSVAASTDAYQHKIESCLEKIHTTESLPELNKMLDELVHDTRIAHIEMVRSQDEVLASRTEIQSAESRIQELQTELAQLSELVREDQLTGSLNRRGLDEVLDREMERSSRRQSPLCIALLDLDDFKKLNDTHGHHAGDEALIHLVRVVKDTLRSMDVIARFGGEEFMIVLPDTKPEDAMQIVTRVQRELTKRIFMHNNERLLITFSSGVAMYATGESQADLVQRADEALYKAKKAGKNRVVSAETS